ncbi:class I adenylate-forming enzyme family protein [Natronorubrum tibetense]|uniref:AMP-dependent synthetase/ligase n=1 Tax=Natronorubrum tibetense GA33 TaxID=1114856 RepID=L9VL67_9EURY|nr:AMP-binding protein [Natronorubrum tibetense]ELY37707.1 AMP-dependent synthetase/ligase [Natronorubrum tibetense GA33]
MPYSDNRAYTLKGCFESSLARNSERTALHFEETDETLTYADLDSQSNAVANALADRGVTPGDRVALMLSNRIEYIIADLAIIKAGAVKVPLNDMLTPDEFEYMLSDSGASTAIAGPKFTATLDSLHPDLPEIERLIAIAEGQSLPSAFTDFELLVAEGRSETAPTVDIEPSETVAHYYTGGTTGKPKGVIHSHRNMTMNVYAHAIELGITGDDTLLLMTPLPHSAGLFLWGGLLTGATMVVRDGFEPEHALQDIENRAISWTFMVPTMIYRLLDHAELDSFDTSTLETLVYGAAPMTANRLEAGLDEFGPVFLQFYGQTEVPNLITTFGKNEHQQAVNAGQDERLESAGQPCLMADVKVVDYESGEELPQGEIGEILATAPYTMEKYFERPDKTAETLVDGWVRTGDIGRIDQTGYLYLLDRDSDVIITGGMNVYSTEVEDALDRHPHIREVAVIGIPDPEWGEAIHAIVVSKTPSLTESDVTAFADENLADYKKPKSVEFVDDIPTTPYGKQDKVALRDRYWEGETRDIA